MGTGNRVVKTSGGEQGLRGWGYGGGEGGGRVSVKLTARDHQGSEATQERSSVHFFIKQQVLWIPNRELSHLHEGDQPQLISCDPWPLFIFVQTTVGGVTSDPWWQPAEDLPGSFAYTALETR